MTEYEKQMLNRFDILLKILGVGLKFALDNSSYKSKTTENIKETSYKENEILNTMQDKKLISRKPNPNDGRGVLVFLTKNGKEKRDITREKVLKFNSMLKKKIGAKKINLFHKVSQEIKNISCELKNNIDS